MIFVVQYREPVKDGFITWHKDEDRIEATCWSEAQQKFKDKYGDDENYSIVGQLIAEIDLETGKQTDFDNLN